MALRFSKMHGAGNDFVLIDRRGPDAPALTDPAAFAEALESCTVATHSAPHPFMKSFTIEHAITGGEDVTYVALEWNLMLPSGAPPRVDDRLLEGDRGCSTAKKVEFCDEKCHVHVVLQSESPWEVIVAPIECVSQSESGFEKTFQGWCLYWLREREKGLPDVVFSVSRGAA